MLVAGGVLAFVPLVLCVLVFGLNPFGVFLGVLLSGVAAGVLAAVFGSLGLLVRGLTREGLR